MMSRINLTEGFSLVSLVLPDDVCSILRMHHQVYSMDPLHSSSQVSADEFVNTGVESLISRFKNPLNKMAKIVLSSDPEHLVAYIVFTPPHAPDKRSPEETERDIRQEVEKAPKGIDKDWLTNLKIESRILSEKLLGKGYEARYWELDALVTDLDYQRRGLGTYLVTWGLELVEEECWKSNGELEGCYIVADQLGARTYTKTGFVELGRRDIGRSDDAKNAQHIWFAKKFA